MSYAADIEYVQDLLEEFDLQPNERISSLLAALQEEATVEEEPKA